MAYNSNFHQLRLKIVFREVDQEMHDGLRDAVLDALANDVEIGFDQSFWKKNDHD